MVFLCGYSYNACHQLGENERKNKNKVNSIQTAPTQLAPSVLTDVRCPIDII